MKTKNFVSRFLTRGDLPAILKIHDKLVNLKWQEVDFIDFLRKPSSLGIICSNLENIIGFCAYSLTVDSIKIQNLAANSKEILSFLLNKLKSKLSSQRRTFIEFDVKESNLLLQLFLKQENFKATVIRNVFDDEDAFRFKFSFEEP